MLKIPPRGFERSEYQARVSKIQALMRREEMDVILLTTKEDIEYYTGFRTQFFASPTRPWFVLLKLDRGPQAIIPTIGESGMKATWIEDIATWLSPNPTDEGITLLSSSIEKTAKQFGCLGIPQGPESSLRMPLGDYQKLLTNLSGWEIKDATPILRAVRYIKSPAEIEKISYVCQIVSQAFKELPELLEVGVSERINCQRFKKCLLEKGVDDFPYLIAGSGKDGYGSIIMEPRESVLQEGDVLVIDTGSIYDGYFCDFDRNYAFGSVSESVKRAYRILFKATEVGFKACRVGHTTADVFKSMYEVLEAENLGGGNVGRLGHSFGLQLTEWPSNTLNFGVDLVHGVVLTLEPAMEYLPGKEMVHEENVLITEDGPVWLSQRADEEIPLIT